jgi:hypothetical protein
MTTDPELTAQPEPPGQAAADPPEAEAAAETPEPTGPPEPRLIKRVVVSYKLGWLPGDWLQTWRRLDRVFARANLKVKATLAPLEDLPEDTDILVIPPELREAGREAAKPGTLILVTPAGAAAGAFTDLVDRLEAGTELRAEQIDAAEAAKPPIYSYRGHVRLD